MLMMPPAVEPQRQRPDCSLQELSGVERGVKPFFVFRAFIANISLKNLTRQALKPPYAILTNK
jgi:hypothetical protein